MLTCAGYDGSIRWRPGERLEQLFERRCDRLRQYGWGQHLAVDALDWSLSYQELDELANQLARFLVGQGVRPGDRVGLLSDRAVDGYVGMLAALKARAAYVPLDAGFPQDRLSYIVSDAGVRVVLTRPPLAERAARLGGAATLLDLDEAEDLIAAQSPDRLGRAEAGDPADDLCYVIYTSGSTGRPKGVAIGHASICNFVRVAAEAYGMAYDDRVYQGMTIAFDFSVEEIWVPWIAGATLVPKPDGDRLLGRELHTFLADRQVTALCCVPTLLATLDEDLPGLRFLLVSGESCPQDLVTRWHRPGRRFLNVYGPTEATVTATWGVVHPSLAGHDRRAAAHLFRGGARPGLRHGAAVGRDGGDRDRGDRARARLPTPPGPDRARLRPGLPRHPEQPAGPDLPDRRPGTGERRG